MQGRQWSVKQGVMNSELCMNRKRALKAKSRWVRLARSYKQLTEYISETDTESRGVSGRELQAVNCVCIRDSRCFPPAFSAYHMYRRQALKAGGCVGQGVTSSELCMYPRQALKADEKQRLSYVSETGNESRRVRRAGSYKQ
ncbi:hypothetical protein NDU88_000299 [Pleurodeles waltl]|uniref:Uncharacterized protein n=1 Tax=Pleurodeles waltl TaxID=8319 RepID=A0AAV7Q3M3_PLEWA|nr:hypothetical protein NDU88_000299 [Pleurodeles waltl]